MATPNNMGRKRRRLADSIIHFVPYIMVMALVSSILFVSPWISNIHAASAPISYHQVPASSSGGEEGSYLYNTEDSVPVFDHGISGQDFTKSTSPKVVEFYDPRCGACQAFKANYIEVAKKVRAQKSNVEFYGVSCEAYPTLCDSYGDPSVPKIFAFPNGSDNSAATGGVQVQKGSGTIYFLSARLMKALRTPDEIVSDAAKLGGGDNELETPKRRHLMGKYDSQDDDNDNQAASEDDGDDEDDDEVSEDEGEGSEEEVESADEYDNVDASEDEWLAAGDQDPSFSRLSEAEEEEDDESEENEDVLPSVDEAKDPSERSEDRKEKVSISRVGREKPPQASSAKHESRAIPPSANHARGREKQSKEGEYNGQASMGQASGRQQVGPSIGRDSRGNLGVTTSDQAYRGKQPTSRQADTSFPPNTCRYEAQCDEKRRKMHVPDHMYHKGNFEAYGCFQRRGEGIFWGYGANEREILKADILSNGMERIWCEKDAPNNSRGNYEDAALEEKYMAQNRKDEQGISGGEAASKHKVQNASGGTTSGSRQQQNEQQSTPEQSQSQAIKESREKDHTQTDAWKNTMAHFEAMDIQRGKEKGYHYQKYKEDRDRLIAEREAAKQSPSHYSLRKNVPEQSAQDGPNEKPHSGPISIANMRGNNRIEEGRGISKPPPPPPQHIPVGGDIFAPNPLNTDPVRAKKFQEYVARRKQMLERKEKMKHPIQAIMGNKNKEEKKQNNVESAIFAHKKKSGGFQSSHQPKKKIADLRPEAQKKTVGEKVLKKIPIVKRAFKRSKGEELLNDAALSFTRGLLMGVFKTNEPLDYKKKAALLDWFDLLSVSLPPEIGLHELIDTLKYNIDNIAQRRETLASIIGNHPLPDSNWSLSCTKGQRSGGFFCGFWKLLHVMSVGFAEQAGGLSLQESSPSIRVFSAKEAGSVVREYMALFFNCDKCSKRFIAQYDECSFQRCHRLSGETVDAPAESWQEFPLWLWQVHNDISRSKSNRAAEFHGDLGKKAEAKKWQRDMQAVYPHIDQCVKCVTSDGIWDLNQVYNHLEKEYWEFGHEVHPKMEKLLEYNDIETKNVSHGLGSYVLISLIIVVGFLAKKHRIRITGRHKKFEAPSSFGRSKKYRDS